MAGKTLEHGEIYPGLIPHGGEFRTMDSLLVRYNSIGQLEGRATWDIGTNARLAAVTTTPFQQAEEVVDGVDFEIASPEDWPPFSGHYPRRPISPGVMAIAHVCNLQAPHIDSDRRRGDVSELDKIRWKKMLVPGDLGSIKIVEGKEAEKVNATIFNSSGGKAVEMHGLLVDPIPEHTVPNYALLEMAAQAAGATLLYSMRDSKDKPSGSPIFIGLDNVKTKGRALLSDKPIVEARVTEFEERRGMFYARAEVVTGEQEQERALVTVGSLILGYA